MGGGQSYLCPSSYDYNHDYNYNTIIYNYKNSIYNYNNIELPAYILPIIYIPKIRKIGGFGGDQPKEIDSKGGFFMCQAHDIFDNINISKMI